MNSDASNGGRCGPLFGNVRCNPNLQSNAIYCNEDCGECGDTDAYKNAQTSDIYDYRPESCNWKCRRSLNQDEYNGGRCGPKFDNSRCNKDLESYAAYCNEDSGWCGVTSKHENAQASDEYDFKPELCNSECPPLNVDTCNPGRCGPLFGFVRCNADLVSYAIYCNEANGWCGNTKAHKNGQTSDEFDYNPSQCITL